MNSKNRKKAIPKEILINNKKYIIMLHKLKGKVTLGRGSSKIA